MANELKLALNALKLLEKLNNGAWPSGLRRILGEDEIAGSNPVAPTKKIALSGVFFIT